MRTRLAVSLLFVALLTGGCPKGGSPIDIPGITGPKMSDTEQIVDVLDDVHRGIENKRIYKVLAHVSKNYYDKEGRDYTAIQAYLNRLFKDYRDIRITRTRPRVIVQGDRARAVETFGTRAKSTNPTSRRAINLQGQVTVYLEKTGDTWQIVEWGAIQ